MKIDDAPSDSIYCGACNQKFSDAADIPTEQRKPCHSCGSVLRIFSAHIRDVVVPRGYIGLKHKRADKKKSIYEETHKPDRFRDNNSMSKVLRIVDREKDIYIEKITDIETGQVWKEVNELLSKHREHGTAKLKK